MSFALHFPAKLSQWPWGWLRFCNIAQGVANVWLKVEDPCHRKRFIVSSLLLLLLHEGLQKWNEEEAEQRKTTGRYSALLHQFKVQACLCGEGIFIKEIVLHSKDRVRCTFLYNYVKYVKGQWKDLFSHYLFTSYFLWVILNLFLMSVNDSGKSLKLDVLHAIVVLFP